LNISLYIYTYVYAQDGHVVDVLNENSNNDMSSSFHTISKPGRKKIAVGIFHDFVENGKSRLLVKDIPNALEVCMCEYEYIYVYVSLYLCIYIHMKIYAYA
jgi:hypothetical protein